MCVIITQNRNKESVVVNGQRAVIDRIEKATVFLRLPNDKCVNVYPVTTILKMVIGKHATLLFPLMR